MSQSTELTLFSEQQPQAPAQLLSALIALTGASAVHLVGGYTQYERSLAQLLEDRADPDADSKLGRRGILHARRINLADAAGFLSASEVIVFHLLESTLGMALHAAIMRDIPEEIRRQAAPSDASITIGRHDIINEDEEDCDADGWPRTTLVGRAWVSLSFFGYDVPRQWKEYSQRIAKIPEVTQIQAALTNLTGGPIGLDVSYSC